MGKEFPGKRMLVLIDKEPVVTVTLSDTMEAQTFSLGKEYNVKGQRHFILILEAYPGQI